MIEYAIEENGNKVKASPDTIFVPQWGLNIKMWKVTRNIVLTYHMGTLYAAATPNAHTTIYREFKLTSPGFDCRLLPNEKIFTFWCGNEIDPFEKDKITQWTKEIRELLRTGNFLTATKGKETPPGRIDIADYTFYFLGMTPEGTPCVTRCSYDDFIGGGFELGDMSAIRVWSPVYGTGQKKRSKNMDAAEWHLLKYEE